MKKALNVIGVCAQAICVVLSIFLAIATKFDPFFTAIMIMCLVGVAQGRPDQWLRRRFGIENAPELHGFKRGDHVQTTKELAALKKYPNRVTGVIAYFTKYPDSVVANIILDGGGRDAYCVLWLEPYDGKPLAGDGELSDSTVDDILGNSDNEQ